MSHVLKQAQAEAGSRLARGGGETGLEVHSDDFATILWI